MFTPTSRYYPVETATMRLPNGKTVVYKRRRFLPNGEEMLVLVEVTVTQGDRLDLITARTLGDPEQYWRICDANNVLDPWSLTDEPGRTIRVPVPQFDTRP